MQYLALIHEENGIFVGTVPDLNNISSFGDTFEKAVQNIKEAAELFCEGLNKLPKPTNYSALLKKTNIEPGINVQLIDLKVEKLIRINVMISSELLQVADKKAAAAFGGNRSAYINHLISNDDK